MEANPALGEAMARVEALRGKWVQVGLPPNVAIGYSGQQLGSHGQAEQHGAYVQQEFVRGGKLWLNRAIVGQEIARAEQHFAAQRQRVQNDVRLAFYDVLTAQRRQQVTAELVAIARKGLLAAEALFRAEDVGQKDVLFARIELQSADLLYKNADNQLAAAWSRLAAMAGIRHLEPTPLVGDLEAVVPPVEFEEALERVLAESPEMAAAHLDVARSRWEVDRASAERVPNVDLQAIFQNDNGTGSNNGALQVSMPLPLVNRNQGGIRQAQAELAAARRGVGRLELGLQRRLAGVYERYASARNQVHDYSRPDGILANSHATLDLVRRAYEGGEIDILDLLIAQRAYFQAQLAYIEALGENWAAAIEIEGLLLKDSLDSASDAAP